MSTTQVLPDYMQRSQDAIQQVFFAQEKILATEQHAITNMNSKILLETTGGFFIADASYRTYTIYPMRNITETLLLERAVIFHRQMVKMLRDKSIATQTLYSLSFKTEDAMAFRQCLPPTIVDLAGYQDYPADGLPFTRNVMNPDNIKNGLAILDYYSMLQFIL